MNLTTKALIELVLLTCAFAAGWWMHKPATCPSDSTTVSDETTVTDSVTKPDGSVTTHTIIHDVDSVKNPPAVVPLPQWSLQLNWKPFYDQDKRWQPTDAMVSRRVLGNLWLGLGYSWTPDSSILLGMRYDF